MFSEYNDIKLETNNRKKILERNLGRKFINMWKLENTPP